MNVGSLSLREFIKLIGSLNGVGLLLIHDYFIPQHITSLCNTQTNLYVTSTFYFMFYLMSLVYSFELLILRLTLPSAPYACCTYIHLETDKNYNMGDTHTHPLKHVAISGLTFVPLYSTYPTYSTCIYFCIYFTYFTLLICEHS